MPFQELADSVPAHALGHRVFANLLAAWQTQILVDIVEKPDADHCVAQPLDPGEVGLARPGTGRVRQPEHQCTTRYGEQVIEQADVVVPGPSLRQDRIIRPAALAADRHQAHRSAVDLSRGSPCRSANAIVSDVCHDAFIQEGAVHVDGRAASETVGLDTHAGRPANPMQPKP